ncbi:hypothetical protein ACFTWH_12640 [Streptomyces sp. NPDC057011]|uniref:hypothetical protein n=1 Tax=unclassified Streptomyces TaxID=2593676 RepID=UPI00362DEB74
MNPLKGLGVCVVLAGIAYALTQIEDMSKLLFGLSLAIIGVSLFTYAASVRRRRNDYRVAGE